MDINLIQVLANMGFPALVAGYVLIRLNGDFRALKDAIIGLSERLDKLLDKLE